MKDLVALLKTNNIRAISEKLKTSAGGFSEPCNSSKSISAVTIDTLLIVDSAWNAA